MSETRTVRLGSLIKPAGKRAGENSDLPVYSVTKHQGFVPSLEYFKKQVFSHETKSYKVVEQGQLAYATIHLDEGSIGIAPEKCIISPMYTVFEVTSEEVIPEYLLLYLRGPRAMATYPLLGQGAIERRMTISLKSLSTLEIPLPPLEQQEREVKSFHLQTTIAKKRERQQELFDELERARFIEKYGNPITNPKNLPMVRLSDIATITTGNSPSRSNKENFGHHIEWIKSNNLGSKYATKASEYLSEIGAKKARIAPSGSILVTCIAGSPSSIGKCSIVDRDVAFNQQINSITPFNPEDLEFIWNQINLFPELIQNKSTGGMKGMVSRSKFSEINILTQDGQQNETQTRISKPNR